MASPDLNIDVNALLSRLSQRLAQAAQTIEIQQLQIEKLIGMLGATNTEEPEPVTP
jgi:hypothetical protein